MFADIIYKNTKTRLNLSSNPQESFSILVIVLLSKHPYMSLNALIINLKQIVQIIIEVSTIENKKECTRLLRSINKRTQLLDKYKRETDFLEQDIWEMVLASDGMPNLRGFGFCNKYAKSKLSGNAERSSLTDKIKENN